MTEATVTVLPDGPLAGLVLDTQNMTAFTEAVLARARENAQAFMVKANVDYAAERVAQQQSKLVIQEAIAEGIYFRPAKGFGGLARTAARLPGSIVAASTADPSLPSLSLAWDGQKTVGVRVSTGSGGISSGGQLTSELACEAQRVFQDMMTQHVGNLGLAWGVSCGRLRFLEWYWRFLGGWRFCLHVSRAYLLGSPCHLT